MKEFTNSINNQYKNKNGKLNNVVKKVLSKGIDRGTFD